MQYNWPIIGHEKEIAQIERDLGSQNLAHAYLFVGPNSVGKYAVCKRLAEILQCEKEGCRECKTCIQVERGSHADTMEMPRDASSIKIADVRGLVERVHMSGNSPYKIFMISQIERMTREAANAFLKVLEEPPVNTLFLLTCDDIHLVLPTIVSRVRIVKFSALGFGILLEKLQEKFPEKSAEEIEEAAIFANAKTGKAIDLLAHPELLADHQKIYHDVQRFLSSHSITDRFSFVGDLVDEPEKIGLFLEILTGVVRSRMLEGQEREMQLKTLLKIEKAGMLLQRNASKRLVLENLMLAL